MKRMPCILLAICCALVVPQAAVGAAEVDPMQPTYARPAVPSPAIRNRRPAAYRLQGIIGTANDRIVIVNGQILRLGDTLGAVRLRRIGASFVELQDRRRRFRIEME